jgi:hypothetical protein
MKILYFAIIIISFLFGIMIGFIYQNASNIKFNTEIKIFEPLSFLLTATIGIAIPFFVKRWIDDTRQVKNSLIKEIDCFFREIEVVKSKILYCNKVSKIDNDDKKEIIFLLERAENQLNCLKILLDEAYKNETKDFSSNITNRYIEYWKFVTSTEFMSSSFVKITPEFLLAHDSVFLGLDTSIKSTILMIHKI